MVDENANFKIRKKSIQKKKNRELGLVYGCDVSLEEEDKTDASDT